MRLCKRMILKISQSFKRAKRPKVISSQNVCILFWQQASKIVRKILCVAINDMLQWHAAIRLSISGLLCKRLSSFSRPHFRDQM